MGTNSPNNNIEFTDNAWEALYDAVDNDFFKDRDADLIYSVLKRRLKFISFGEYLKRYIYRNAGLTEPFGEVPIKTYQQIIKGAFADNSTPQSFEPTSAKLSALSKNWLTQQTVNRKVVFLLGFGLAMGPADVNEFLTKALREQEINAKNPFEVICWYCYQNHYSFPKFEKLWRIFCDTPPNSLDMRLLYSDCTIGAGNYMTSINNEAALIAYVTKLKAPDNSPKMSVSARMCFNELFDQARDLVAQLYNSYRSERIGQQERILHERDKLIAYNREDITASDLEHIISSAIPVDKHGNLVPGRASKLNAQFAGKRFSRQHISEIIAGKADVTRFDLITLNFFVYSQTLDKYPNTKARYISYIESTNRILNQCLLGELCISNPYECFILMCILSEDPLGTYADVWEMSYEQFSEFET